MAQNIFTSNGWDLIAAATQDSLNTQLAKIPMIPVKATKQITFLGTVVTAVIDITIGTPQIFVKQGSGRQVDIHLQVSGTVTLNSDVITIAQGQQVIVTTELMQLEAEVHTTNGIAQTTYDLVLDFESKDILVDIQLAIPEADLAALLSVLKLVIQNEIGNGKEYKVASFTLSNEQVQDYKALIPYMADFSFVQDTQTPGRSNLLILMQTVSKTKGETYFNAPLLPADQDFAVLASNQLFLQNFVMPPLISKVKDEAKNPDSVASQISLNALPAPPSYMYEVANNANINLNKDHDPWISTIKASIDTTEQALLLYLDAKADVTFLDIHVDAWDKSWQQFQIDEKGNVSLVQVKEDKNKSTEMEWWKWLIAVLLGGIALIVTGIIYAIVENNNPDLGGTFASIGQNLVQWPNQKVVVLKKITTPNHVVFFLEVHFND